MIGYMDIFASVASPLADFPLYCLTSNVRVEDCWSSAPLPASAGNHHATTKPDRPLRDKC